jgi:hypothetical protein
MKNLIIILLLALLLVVLGIYTAEITKKGSTVSPTSDKHVVTKANKSSNSLKKHKDYLFVLTSERGSFKYISNNKYELTLNRIYPHVLFFGNEDVSKTGTLFASGFLKKLKANVLDTKSPTIMRIKLYRGNYFKDQLAQPLEVKIISIKEVGDKEWEFIVTPSYKGSLDGIDEIIYPDFYIFNSDLPGKGFIDS